jgi:sigma-B regulation protein RsbU (phosphoserine phosphatase)
VTPNRIRFSLAVKFASFFGVFAVLSGALICSITYTSYRNSMLEHYGRYASGTAALAASILDPEDLLRYAETLQRDEYYSGIEKKLEEIRRSLGVKYLYVQMPVSDAEYMYLFDLYDPSEANDVDTSLGAREDYNEDYKTAKLAMSTGKPAAELDITRGEYGYLASAYVPISRKDSDIPFAYVGVDIAMDDIVEFLMRYMGGIASATAAVMALCFGALFFLVRRSVVSPIRAIAKKTGEFTRAVGDEDFAELHIRSNDEIGDLTASVNVMFGEIRDFTRRLADETARRERVQSELDTARSIQEGVLPKIFPPFNDFSGAEVFASMTPAKEVGGDFYDFFVVGENKLALVIADASGKGVPAALFMMVARTLIRNCFLSGGAPHEVLRIVNNQLCQNNEAGMFVTVFAGILDTNLGLLRYVNAGHTPPVFLRGGRASWLPIDPALVLGVMEDVNFTTQETTFEENDLLLLYTDGVIEAMDEQNALFGRERLIELLSAKTSEIPSPLKLVQAVGNAVQRFAGSAEQADDITMLAVEAVSR